MRNNILIYLCLFLWLLAIFLLLSFNDGFGYVYMQWLGWQLQSNVLLVLLGFFFGSTLLYGFWYLLKIFIRKRLRTYVIPKSYRGLHPYERLGILWLLHAERVEKDNIIATYQASVLVQPLIRARILLNQGEIEQAKQSLKQAKNPLFELSELIKVEISLAENNYPEVLDRLNFLSVQPLSTWLAPVQDAYNAELLGQWAKFAKRCPWCIFKAAKLSEFNREQNLKWLQALLMQIDDVESELKVQFIDWYQVSEIQIAQYSLDEQVILLKLMSQFEALNQQSHTFAEHLLSQKFIPEVLYIWLNQSLNATQFDIAEIEQRIHNWQIQYPAQPSLSFAQWHIYQRQGKTEQANELLHQYPDDAYMAYLRLQEAVKSSHSLQADLRQLFKFSKQDFKLDL